MSLLGAADVGYVFLESTRALGTSLKGSTMKPFITSAVLAIALGGMAAPAQAHHALANAVKASIELRDGSTLHVFKDGKMSKEDAFGRAVFLKRGEILTAKDGRQITAVGNEVARLEALLKEDHTG